MTAPELGYCTNCEMSVPLQSDGRSSCGHGRILTSQSKFVFADAPSEAFAALPQVQALIAALSRERDDALAFLDNAVSNAPEPLADLGSWLADMLDEDQWPTAERYLNAAVKSLADATALARMLQEAENDILSVVQRFVDPITMEDIHASIRAMKGEKG